MYIVGRSGFTNETERQHFARLFDLHMNHALHLLRRAGVNLQEKMMLVTTATEGDIDVAVRRLAAQHGIVCAALINTALMPYVDPRAKIMPGVLVTDDLGDLSDLATAAANIMLGFSGGDYALFQDLPYALKHGKKVILVHNSAIHINNVNAFKLFQDGTAEHLMGNHVAALMTEQSAITIDLEESEFAGWSSSDLWDPTFMCAAAAEAFILSHGPIFRRLCQRMRDLNKPMSPQAIWHQIAIVHNPDELAVSLARTMGISEALVTEVDRRAVSPVITATEELKGAQVILSITGRSQWINKTTAAEEAFHVYIFMEQTRELLFSRHGIRPRDVGILFGHGDYGTDGVVSKTLTRHGFPTIGIQKPEWVQWATPSAKRNAAYALSADTYKDFSRAYLGHGLGVQSDALIVFEGNAGVKEHIRAAIELGIPVRVVALTSDPLLGNFWDVQKQKLFRYRLQNVGRWVSQIERDAAIGEFTAEMESLLGVTIDRTLFQHALQTLYIQLKAMQANIADKITRTQLSQAKAEDIGPAIDCVTELIDMLDPSTTIEGSHGLIQFFETPEQLAEFISEIVKRKK